MMLRVSSEVSGIDADLRPITLGEEANSGVPAEAQLLHLVEASLDVEREAELPAARQALQKELGADALVDAAAVIGNFQRMTRIADGTGIPLDAPIAAMTADLREDLGINAFGSAAYTPKVGPLKRWLFRLLAPLMIKRLRKRIVGNQA